MEQVAEMHSQGKFMSFSLYVVVLKGDKYSADSYYAGPDAWPHFTVNPTKAKFYHTKAHAHQAIFYHGWKNVEIGQIMVRGELVRATA